MARLDSYKGGLGMVDGFISGGDFPLMEAHDIQTKLDGTRLDENLSEMERKITELDKANITVDSELSGTSTNPVQNKVIYNNLQKKLNRPTNISEHDRLLFIPKGETTAYADLGTIPEISLEEGFDSYGYGNQGCLIPKYINKQLVTHDPTGDFSAVNLKTLNKKLSERYYNTILMPDEGVNFEEKTGYIRIPLVISLLPGMFRIIVYQSPDANSNREVTVDTYDIQIFKGKNEYNVIGLSGSPVALTYDGLLNVYIANKSAWYTNISIDCLFGEPWSFVYEDDLKILAELPEEHKDIEFISRVGEEVVTLKTLTEKLNEKSYTDAFVLRGETSGYLHLTVNAGSTYSFLRFSVEQKGNNTEGKFVDTLDSYLISFWSSHDICEIKSVLGSPIAIRKGDSSSEWHIYIANKCSLTTLVYIDYLISNHAWDMITSAEIIESVPEGVEFVHNNSIVGKLDKIENATSTRYVYMIDKKGGTEKKIAIGMGSGTKGVTLPANELMLPQYNDAGRLCASDPGSDYHVVNLRTLNTRLGELTARLDALTPSEPEVEIPTEFAWLDILSNAENAQILFNKANKYKFRGTARDQYDFEGDGDLDMQQIIDQVTFNMEFTPETIPNFDDNQYVTGTISNFSIEVNHDYGVNEYDPGTYWYFDCTAELNNDTAAMSVYKDIDENNGPYIEIYIAIDVSIESHWENEGGTRTGSGKLSMFNRRFYGNDWGHYSDGQLWEIQAYVGKTSETAPFFPETMSLRQQSLNRQLIAFLEERRANNRNNNN